MEEENYLVDIEIVSVGDTCDSIIFIAQGKIEIEIHDEDGQCQIIDVLKRGDIIGPKSILFDAPYQFSAISSENCKVYILKKSYFDQFKNKL